MSKKQTVTLSNIEVIDGDTFKGTDDKGKQKRVRVGGLNARELKQYGGKTDMKKAKKILDTTKKVTCTTDAYSYGRTVSNNITDEKGRDISKLLKNEIHKPKKGKK
jgi:endonuclease YncB( thermonuclease family)